MLARLLRRVLLGQLVFGAGLGWLLARLLGSTAWLMLPTALLMPALLTLLTVLVSALKSRAPGAGWLWWRSLAGETIATLRVFVLQQPWAHEPPAIEPPWTADQRLPVLLVHGYLCNHRVWDALAARLRAAGHPVLRVDLEPLFTSIDDYAVPIEDAVAALCRQSGRAQVALIGHSMGGLAIRAWLRSYSSERAATVITLGTPHAGTQIDPRPRTPNGRQMQWHSAWLQQLAASETPAMRAVLRIALTPHDNIVYPQREQIVRDVPVTVFGGLGHLELCSHPGVIAWVLQQLVDLSDAEGKPWPR